jgi:WXG100 family type VII secretion target
MGAMKVTPEQLNDVSSQVSVGANDIATQLSDLRSKVSALGGEWVGAAAGQFDQLWEEWGKGAAQIQEALSGISRLLGEAGKLYASTEEQIASSMRG